MSFTVKINANVVTSVFKDYEGRKHGDKVAVNGKTHHIGMNDETSSVHFAQIKVLVCRLMLTLQVWGGAPPPNVLTYFFGKCEFFSPPPGRGV